jgi:hypothetical protein
MAFRRNTDAKGKTEVQADYGPRTADDWRKRVAALEGDVVAAEQALTEAHTQRRSAAGNVIVFNAAGDALSKLEDQEREAERKLDSQRAAVEVAKGELQKAIDVEERARLEELKQRRDVIAADVKFHAAEVDKAFAAAGSHLTALKAALGGLKNAGGGALNRTLSGCVARCAYHHGLRGFLECGYVGGNQHLLPLAQQLGFLTRGIEPIADNSVADTTAAKSA